MKKQTRKILSLVLALVMLVSMIPVPVLAEEDSTAATYKDGTYTKTATVNPDEWEDFTAYDLSVDVVIESGKITNVAFSEGNTFGNDEDNETYSGRALNGRGKYVGVAAQIIEKNGVEGVDVVTTATSTSNAIISAVTAALEDAAVTEEQPAEPETTSAYVLMNIPYDEFYIAEGVSGVDVVTTATVKTYNQGKAAGSYHTGYTTESASNAVIEGVTYPVYVEDLAVLSGLTQVTDEDSATITVASGKKDLTTKEVTGADLLFASGDYAYYVMSTEPSMYKTLTVGEDGTFSFSAVNASAVDGKDEAAELVYTGNYTDIELRMTAEEVVNASSVNAVILTAGDGEKYALRHVENVWDNTDLGWNWEDLDGKGLEGKKITNVTYYLETEDVYGIYSYDVDLTVKRNAGEVTAEFTDANTIVLTNLPEGIENAKATVKTKVGRGETATVIAEEVAVDVVNGTITTTDAAENGTYVVAITSDNYADISTTAYLAVPGYVLMNIPYDEFYEAEGISGVDVATTATVKTYNQSMAAGSYHEGYAAADPISDAKILGITYPVYVEDLAVLEDLTKVTDEDTATISVASGKSSLTEKEVSGVDLLFASGDYAYYVMTGEPTHYKALSVEEDGSFTFSAVNGTVTKAEGMEAELSYGGHYTDIELVVSAEEITDTAVVNAVTLTTSDGTEYALRHVEHIWRKTDLGWNWEELDGNGLSGKTITNVTYYLKDTKTDENGTEETVYGIYSYDVNLTVKLNAGEVTAEFADENTITLTGLPEDIQNAKATVKTQVGRGETATVIAENVDVVNGTITTTDAATEGTYVITITSDNYADFSVNADYQVAETPEEPGESEDDTESETPAESEDGTESETPAESEDDTESETPAESESSTESANQSESAQTGDSSNMILWMVLMMSCVAAIALIQVKRRSDMEQE